MPDTTTSHALVDLIPFGPLDPMIPQVMAANIQTVVGLTADIQTTRADPAFAFVATRRQFDAAKIITSLASESGKTPFRLGIIGHDMGVPILTYVFGESQIGGRAAVISTFRLVDGRPDMVYERAAKVGIHEIGHLLGLNHCRELDCLMHFSRQLEQLDRLPLRLCAACAYETTRCLKNPALWNNA